MMETVAPPRRKLYLMRLFYFVSIGASGFLLPFLSLFFRRQGLSGTEIGLLGTVQATVALIAAPVWGRWSDRIGRPRRLIQIALLGTAVIGLVLGRQSQFIPIALLVGLDALISAGWMPLSDMLASSIAEEYDNVGFGSVRLWGSLGWTLVTAVAGRLIELLGLYFGFVAHAVGMGLAAITVQFVPPPAASTLPVMDTAAGGDMRQVVRAIGRNPYLVNLAAGLGFAWLLGGGLYQFEAIFLDELGASEAVIGLASALSAAVELPGMLWADRMLRRFSAGWLLRLAFLLQIMRMAGILLVPAVPMIVAMRVLLGLQFSLYSVGIIGYVNAYTSKAYRVTTLALITITLRNLIVMISNPVGGLVYDAVGAYWLYALGLVGALGGWLALLRNRHEPRPA